MRQADRHSDQRRQEVRRLVACIVPALLKADAPLFRFKINDYRKKLYDDIVKKKKERRARRSEKDKSGKDKKSSKKSSSSKDREGEIEDEDSD